MYMFMAWINKTFFFQIHHRLLSPIENNLDSRPLSNPFLLQITTTLQILKFCRNSLEQLRVNVLKNFVGHIAQLSSSSKLQQ